MCIRDSYKDLGSINISFTNALKDKALSPKDRLEATSALYHSLKALQGFIDPVNYTNEKYKGVLKELHQKRGLIQGKAWAKRQDVSARSTITVEPSLGLNEVGVPRHMAYEMFKPFVIRELKEQGMKISQAVKEYNDETPISWNALQTVLRHRPVILNRAPSLHKLSVQAFKPILFEGKTIR